MSERPSDGWELDELRDEFDWMHDFLASMAERIRQDPDVHSLADYVDKLEEQRDHLREAIETLWPRAAFTMSKACKETWIAELGELGVEVEDDEHSEY